MKIRVIGLTILIWVAPVFSQNYLDVIRPFYGMRGVSGSESGVFPISAAHSNAVLGNPALLSYSQDAFFSMDIGFDQVSGTSIYNSQKSDPAQFQRIRFNNMSYIYPVHVYRGAWVWGFNLQPVHSFSSIQSFEGVDIDGSSDFHYSYLNRSTGSIYALSMASSFLWTRNTSLGFGVSLLTGKNEYHEVYQEKDDLDYFTFENYLDSLYIIPSYRGFAARMGMVTDLSSSFRFGLSLEFPSRLSVTESSGQEEMESYDDGSETVLSEVEYPRIDYVVWGPWRLGLGLAFGVEPLKVSVNYRYHSFSTALMVSDLLDSQEDDLDEVVKGEISSFVQDVHEYSAAVNWSMTPLNISFAATVENHPLNEILESVLRLDAGFGYRLTPQVGITSAFRSSSWQSDMDHELSSGSFRTVEVKNSFSQISIGVKYFLD